MRSSHASTTSAGGMAWAIRAETSTFVSRTTRTLQRRAFDDRPPFFARTWATALAISASMVLVLALALRDLTLARVRAKSSLRTACSTKRDSAPRRRASLERSERKPSSVSRETVNVQRTLSSMNETPDQFWLTS